MTDIFQPFAKGEPPSLFKRVQHAQAPKGCNIGEPIQTNNFYNNLTLEDQTFPIWTLPYSLWFTKDPGEDVGIAFNHTDASQKVFGPEADANPVQFYFNPPRIKSFVISAEGFQPENTQLTFSNHEKMSVDAKLMISNDRSIEFPFAQGMGFITALFKNVKAVIASQVGVQEFQELGTRDGNTKYHVKLFNQVVWSLYVIQSDVRLSLRDPNHIVATHEGSFTVQFAKGNSVFYDDCSGTWPTRVSIGGRADSKAISYEFNYEMSGRSRSGNGIVWCLPHQQETLLPEISGRRIDLALDSPTKGIMYGYSTNTLKMTEDCPPTQIDWYPWASFFDKTPEYSDSVKGLIKKAAQEDAKQDIVGMANIDSMYTSGKILDKFAYIAHVCHFILRDDELTQSVLPRVKEAIEIFAKNQQKFPLVYDTTWKGLISSAEPGADFGNSNYNDHHFHYGYHIHAIALIARIDPKWLSENDNLVLNYAITMVRDVASPRKDEFFPESRSFDWFHGHSFAHGIFASGDGKDEESSSEDYHFAYGMKLFAKVIGDQSMEQRSNLMLAIMRRAMNMYMLFSDDNKIQPPNFIKNKVAGITFENKIDFATYFGRGTISDEWIHGIHMLPITPISSYIRKDTFVKEEWDQKLGRIIDQIPDGWKGILMLNLSLFDPKAAWKWFSRDDWEDRLIDNGMSRTWSLAFIAGIGGAQ